MKKMIKKSEKRDEAKDAKMYEKKHKPAKKAKR